MKAIRPILFLAVIFIIVSCEKTEMIDSKIEQSKKCKMIYIYEGFEAGEAAYFGLKKQNVDPQMKQCRFLPDSLEKGYGYAVAAMFQISEKVTRNQAMAFFDIEKDDNEKVVTLIRIIDEK
jgi:hypothetical protein